jgi:hypothetical protein
MLLRNPLLSLLLAMLMPGSLIPPCLRARPAGETA